MAATTTTAPLLQPTSDPTNFRSTALSLLLNQAASASSTGSRRSSMVRETAAMQLEERRVDWGYSKPVVALDMAWNIAFALVSLVMLLFLTLSERPNTPIRVWISGYALQCVFHVILVWFEYRKRRRSSRRRLIIRGAPATSSSDSSSSDSDDDALPSYRRSSITKKCESINTMASFVWWIVGFYWIVSGGDALLHNAPRLYWLAVLFLAFDVLFAIFCVALACMIGIALCCCLPCIIAILYAVAGQEGATDSDLSMLPKYKYKIRGNPEKSEAKVASMIPVGGELADELVLSPEDAECCICLNSYDDGAELNTLPCTHHFHMTCIVKWLKINASCPLCKYNILKGNNSPV